MGAAGLFTEWPRKAKIRGEDTNSMEGILKDAAAKNELVVFIIYDLPNRDCHAKASNGYLATL